MSPTVPQRPAGKRTEPPVSVPSAIGTSPAPTATAEPLDEPPGSMGRRVPGVVRRALVVVDADAAEGELHRVGLAHENHAGASQPPDDGCVLFRHVPGEEPGAGGGRHAPDVEEVLGGVGDPVERPQVLAAPERELGRARLGQRPLPGDRDEGVERPSSAAIRSSSVSASATGLMVPARIFVASPVIDSKARAGSDMRESSGAGKATR